jgi:uncharacterized protein (DUF2147 family)
VWLNEARDGVRVSKCRQALCSTTIWLKEPIDSVTGRPQIDDKNPAPALARRPIIGLSLFQSMKPSGDHWSGRIYNADNGKTYASDVSLADAATLNVSGCVLFICGSERWTKISEARRSLWQSSTQTEPPPKYIDDCRAAARPAVQARVTNQLER